MYEIPRQHEHICMCVWWGANGSMYPLEAFLCACGVGCRKCVEALAGPCTPVRLFVYLSRYWSADPCARCIRFLISSQGYFICVHIIWADRAMRRARVRAAWLHGNF